MNVGDQVVFQKKELDLDAAKQELILAQMGISFAGNAKCEPDEITKCQMNQGYTNTLILYRMIRNKEILN